MRRSRLIVGGAVASVLVIAIAALLLSRALGLFPATGLEVVSPTPQCPGPSYQVGDQESAVPSITPRNDCTPSFTVQDVLDYEQSHPFGNMRMVSVGHPTVKKVLFITSAAASQRMGGEFIGLPDNAMVCFVELYGTYHFYPPFAPASEHTGTMHEVFDAHTGVLLVSGS
jgi:hypothetical protein